MPVDLSADSIIRAGSGLLYMVLGTILLARRSPSRGARALAAFCLVYGVGFVVFNIVGLDPTLGPPAAIAVGVSYVAFFASMLWLALVLPPAGRHERTAFLAAGLMVVVWAVVEATFWIPAWLSLFETESTGFFAATGALRRAWSFLAYSAVPFNAAVVVFPMLCAWRYARSAPRDRVGRNILAVLALSISLFGAMAAGADVFVAPGLVTTFFGSPDAIMGLAFVGLASVSWLWALSRHPSHEALAAALAPLAAALVGMTAQLVLGSEDALSLGLVGIARIVGWLALVALCVRHNHLGLNLPWLRENRAAVAMGALAALFVVAQVMQNFLGAKYGLVTGGVVAGVFLFAANPVQRAVERIAGGDVGGGGAPAGRYLDSASQEAAFRDAVRLAFKDRRFEPKEELALANLADRLGLSARRATEIRHEVEQAGRSG